MAEKKEFGKPRLRLPRANRVKKDQIIEVAVRVTHNSSTGLGFADGKYFSKQPAYFLKKMEVFFDGELISTYEMTSATSPNPLIRFKMKATKEAPVKIVVTNSDGIVKEATQNLRFG